MFHPRPVFPGGEVQKPDRKFLLGNRLFAAETRIVKQESPVRRKPGCPATRLAENSRIRFACANGAHTNGVRVTFSNGIRDLPAIIRENNYSRPIDIDNRCLLPA